jgi:hypothetical protein
MHNSFSCMFISILYMFRAPMCSSSGKPIVSTRHLVYVTLCRWIAHIPAYQTVTYIVTYTRCRVDVILLMSTCVLQTCRELEQTYTKKNCASSWLFTRTEREFLMNTSPAMKQWYGWPNRLKQKKKKLFCITTTLILLLKSNKSTPLVMSTLHKIKVTIKSYNKNSNMFRFTQEPSSGSPPVLG